jgi:hypothetical protein
MLDSPSLLARITFVFVRGLLVIVALLLAFAVSAVVILPLAIFAPPLAVILAGLLVLYVLGATQSMAADWQARRLRRRHVPAPTATSTQRVAPAWNRPADAPRP